jgi:hypothetical protein
MFFENISNFFKKWQRFFEFFEKWTMSRSDCTLDECSIDSATKIT